MSLDGYAYKYVSVFAGGQLDWEHIKRARERGWDPVPFGEEPDPLPDAIGMTADQLANFKLCRMPLEKHTALLAERDRLNAALASSRVQAGVAARKTSPVVYEAFLAAANDPTLDAQVTLAYDWLKQNGLL